MDKQQRQYLLKRLGTAYQDKQKQVKKDTETKQKPLTGEQLRQGIIDGTFQLRRRGPIKQGYGTSGIVDVFQVSHDMLLGVSIDEAGRNKRLKVLQTAYNRAVDDVMLNNVDADLAAILQAFEGFKA